MTIIYVQIEPDFIQTSETHEDGSFTSGIIRRDETRKDADDIDFSPWGTLDPSLVQWLDVPAYEAGKAAETAMASFKSSRQALINNAVVTANAFPFDADEVSIGRMGSAILAATGEADTYVMQWSLANTAAGVMTSVTLADIKLAHRLAVINMSSVWGA
jgi:hypothetical protein